METKRDKERQTEFDKILAEKIKLHQAQEELRAERERYEQELAALENSKNALAVARGKEESIEHYRSQLIDVIHRVHIIDVKTALCLVENVTKRKLEELSLDYDPLVLDAIEFEKATINTDIISKWRNSQDFRAQKAVFAMTASNEQLVRLNPVQKIEKSRGDNGTMFQVRFVDKRSDDTEIQDAEEVRE